MASPRKIRGEYRPFYEALFHGKDYRRLSAEAKLCLVTLKGLCGVSGIKSWPSLVGSLSELTGHTEAKCRAAVKSLIDEKWIEHEDGIVWVVRGLDFEPQMTPNNENHRKQLAGLMMGLPSADIVQRFRERYSTYFVATALKDGDGIGNGIRDGIGDGIPNGHANPLPLPLPTSLSPTPSPTPFPSPSPAQLVIADEATHRTRLVVHANKGISELYGEQPNPINWSSRSTQEAAEELQGAGVELEFAERKLYELAKGKRTRDNKAPASLKYFVGAIVDAWAAESVHRVVATMPTLSDLPAKQDDRDPNYFTAVRLAREGDTEWQQYCRTHHIDWMAA